MQEFQGALGKSWEVTGTGVGISGLGGDFNDGRILGKVSLRITRKRIIYVVNPSNSKGDALLHYLGGLRRIASKRILVSKRSVARGAASVGGIHRRVKVIFRRFGLFPRLSIVSGVALTPIRLGQRGGRATGTETLRLLRAINLSRGTSTFPDSLSNNRGREITVTHTLTVGPRVVLFSRPASTLSPRVINSILRIVGGLTGRNVAVIIIARRVNFTERIKRHIVFVSNKCVIRRNAPARMFNGPRGPHARSFLGGMLWSHRAGITAWGG